MIINKVAQNVETIIAVDTAKNSGSSLFLGVDL